jgi:CRP-like cAMP-binding protein
MKDLKQRQISTLALFDGCTTEERRWIASVADTLDVGAGSQLAIAGRTAREFIVIVEGAATGGDVVFGPGAFFGELGLLDERPQPMTIEALTDARLLVFGIREFRSLLQNMPSVARKIMRELVGRVRELDQDVRSLRAVS